MTNIVFASNNLVHWPLSEASTQAGSFDATRVPYAIVVNNQQNVGSIAFAPVAGNVSWTHFRLWFDNNWSGGNPEDYFLLKGFDTNANLLFDLTKYPNSSKDGRTTGKVYHGGGNVSGTQAFPFNEDKMNSVDVRYENDGAKVNMQLYANGALALELEWVGVVAFGQVTSIQIGAAFTNTGAQQWMSEIIVADNDTRNARLNLLRPTAVGGETDWVGIATDLADNDPTSGMTAITAEQRQTVDLSAYTGAGNLSALVVSTVALAGANAPQNIRHTVRMSTVNYDGPADIPLSETLRYGLTDFQINPATSLPWTSADLVGLEMGFIAKA